MDWRSTQWTHGTGRSRGTRRVLASFAGILLLLGPIPGATHDRTHDRTTGRDQAAAGPAAAGAAPAPVARPNDRDGDRIHDRLAPRLARAGSARVPVIVQLKDTDTAHGLRRLRHALGAFPISHAYRNVPAFSAALTATQVRRLAAVRDEVELVEPDEVARAVMDSARRDFGVDAAVSELGATGDAAHDGDKVYGPGDMTVAVIDTGIDANHPTLDEGKVIAFRNFVPQQSGCPAQPAQGVPFDDHFHGTHVAGIIAGDGDGGADARGVAPGASLVGIKVLGCDGSGSFSWIAAGVDWAITNRETYGIDALNLSLGANTLNDGTDTASRLLNQAVASGIAVFVAAGNSGPAARTVGMPGSAKFATTVGAMADTTQNGLSLASFSSRGPTLDGRVKPDIVAPGVGITAARANTTGLWSLSGTSMATPFTAGVGVLALQLKPSLRPSGTACDSSDTSTECRDGVVDATMRTPLQTLMTSTAKDWGALGADNDYGSGRLDAYAVLSGAAASAGSGGPTLPRHDVSRGSLAAGASATLNLRVPSGSSAPTVLTAIVDGPERAARTVALSVRGSSGTVLASATGNRQASTATNLAEGDYQVVLTPGGGAATYVVDASDGYFPVGVPGAPTGVSATRGDGRATVSWTPAAGVGSSAVHTVTATPGGASATTAASSVTLTGLSNGTAYTFKVQTTNDAGTSPLSAASAPVTPVETTTLTMAASATEVWAPTSVTLSGTLTGSDGRALGGRQVQLWWHAPESTSWGTGLYATTATDGAWSYSYTATSSWVYQATAAETGAQAKALSPVVTITARQGVPNAPTAVSATPGNAQASVAWTAPTYVGAGAVTGYTVTASPGGATASVGASARSATVTGLSNGTAYTFSVVATNGKGSSAAGRSGTVTPREPTALTLAASSTSVDNGATVTLSGKLTGAGDRAIAGRQVQLWWRAPETTAWSTGWYATTGSDGTWQASYTSTRSWVYQATVAEGGGLAKATSPTVTVTSTQAVPNAPAGVSASAGNARATVSWAEPTYAGASAITGYTVTASPGGATATVGASARSAVITGLSNGTAYTFSVVATNGSGSSAAARSAAVTPLTPTSLTLTSSATSVSNGATVTLSGKLTGADGAPLAGKQVQLWWRAPETTTWYTGWYATTGGDGTWQASYTSTRSWVYQATVAAGGGLAKATSPVVAVTSR